MRFEPRIECQMLVKTLQDTVPEFGIQASRGAIGLVRFQWNVFCFDQFNNH